MHFGTMRIHTYVLFLVAALGLCSFIVITHAGPSDMSTAILIRVDQSGKGDFKKVQDAIDSVPSNNTELIFIWVKPGVYREKIVVPADKPFITISGSKPGTTIITWSDGGEIYESPTFSVLADDFVGRLLTVRGGITTATVISKERLTSYLERQLPFTKTVFYAQYKCYGPGADVSRRVNWSRTLSEAEAAPFMTKDMIGGLDWLRPSPTHFKKRSGVIAQSADGNYEKISVPADKPFITISGSNATTTIITLSNGGEIFETPTFSVLADDFVERFLTIQNTFGPGEKAVALRVSGDRAAFYGCRILSYQDTLLDDVGRHYFNNCYDEGATDFIFGNAASLYEVSLPSPEDHRSVFYAEYKCSGPGADVSGRVKWPKLHLF
ncbi:hypothetical protein IFM89_017698 [Coptis chinensis]|uniref:pectinesterase n=1 Tax=Coptis chinensis TaxID=261450 RepID=A0A835I421_9MAGN|nr:hypothetical protein IFM89_017698 [Coptis chinensis]